MQLANKAFMQSLEEFSENKKNKFVKVRIALRMFITLVILATIITTEKHP